MGQEVLKKFDRYLLLDCIAQGGMAEIFRARPVALEAASRLVVIKRILGGYGKNADFRKMFKSEIKVMLGFSHPNIVQLYDFGEAKGQPFIAMELIDGKNLRQFISRFGKRNKRIPVDIAVFVAEQVAGGLYYAHTFSDKITGEPLSIVHRDISPQNILISYDGNIKIIDFGIAKARTNVESTKVGIIKGKPSYLSPEQIVSAGDDLDGRSDVFSLGAVLWEMLTGKKLFSVKKGENEFAVLKLIESCDSYVRPPSALNPSIPKELDEIVMKSLTKKREKRYQSAEEFQRVLRRFLYSYSPDFSPQDLSKHSREIFKEVIVEDRKLLQKLSAKGEKLLKNSPPSSTPPRIDESKSIIIPEKKEPIVPPKIGSRPAPPPPKKQGSTQTFISSPSLGSQISISRIDGKKKIGTQTRIPQHRNTQSIQLQRGTMGGRPMPPARRHSSVLGPLLGTGVVAFLALVMFKPLDVCYPFIDSVRKQLGLPACKKIEKGEGTDTTVVVNPPVTPGRTDKFTDLYLDISPVVTDSNTRIIITAGQQDIRVKVNAPKVRVPMDKTLLLRIDNPEFRTYTEEFSIPSNGGRGPASVSRTINLRKLKFGYIQVGETTPSAIVKLISLDDSYWTMPKKCADKYTPTRCRVPTGSYKVILTNPTFGKKKELQVEIEEDKVKALRDINLYR